MLSLGPSDMLSLGPSDMLSLGPSDRLSLGAVAVADGGSVGSLEPTRPIATEAVAATRVRAIAAEISHAMRLLI
jgi:hypothetical protein